MTVMRPRSETGIPIFPIGPLLTPWNRVIVDIARIEGKHGMAMWTTNIKHWVIELSSNFSRFRGFESQRHVNVLIERFTSFFLRQLARYFTGFTTACHLLVKENQQAFQHPLIISKRIPIRLTKPNNVLCSSMRNSHDTARSTILPLWGCLQQWNSA